MKESRLTVALIRAIPALALAAPCVLFGFIYVLAVQPRRTAENAAIAQADALAETVGRMRSLIRNTPVAEPVAQREFELRTPSEDRAIEAGEAITSLLNGPAVGGVSHLSIETGDPIQPGENDLDPRLALFEAPISYTALKVSFDARYTQIGRFFWNLRTLPSTFELRSVEMAPAAEASLMRTTITLFLLQRADPAPLTALQVALNVDMTSAPDWNRDPFIKAPARVDVLDRAKPAESDPVVHTILYSSQNRAALVDGRIVRAKDRLGAGFVREIEQNAVVFVTDSGLTKRLPLEEPNVRATKR